MFSSACPIQNFRRPSGHSVRLRMCVFLKRRNAWWPACGTGERIDEPQLLQRRVKTHRVYGRRLKPRTYLLCHCRNALARGRRGRRRLCLLHVFHVAEQGAPVVETVAAFHVVAAAGYSVVVFVHVAVLLPLLQEQLIGLPREVAPHLGVVVIAQTKVDQIVHWTPDTAAPVVLVGKGGIVARYGGNDPLAPELIGVEQVLLNHGLCLGGRGGAGQQRIEVGGRKPVAELAGVQVLVQKDAVRLAPQRGEAGTVAVRARTQLPGFG